MVKTLCFHYRELGFKPWSGKFSMPSSVAKKLKQNKEIINWKEFCNESLKN